MCLLQDTQIIPAHYTMADGTEKLYILSSFTSVQDGGNHFSLPCRFG